MKIDLDFKGAIFDLDGVLVDTAKYHYQAWSTIAERLGFTFTLEDNERLKGVSRAESLEILLEIGGIEATKEEKEEYLLSKNETYVQIIQKIEKSEILPGADCYLHMLKEKGVKLALGSASKNAMIILERLGIEPLFDAIIDGNKVSRSKPDPEVFARAAEALELDPAVCVVFEDSIAGIIAAHNAGIVAVGIGSAQVLTEADYIVSGLQELV